MLNNFILIVLFTFAFSFAHAQDDSLSLFRAPSKVSAKHNQEQTGGLNALIINIASFGRGATSISYERYFEQFHFLSDHFYDFGYFVGIGLSAFDVAGAYDITRSKFYFNDKYSSRTKSGMGIFYEAGIKFYRQKELDGPYFSLAFSEMRNNQIRTFGSEYIIKDTGKRNYDLYYRSDDIKLVYGVMKGFGKNFYNDFSIGIGAHIMEFDNLIVEKIDPLTLSSTYPDNTIILFVEDNQNELTIPWIFLGWRVGMRF